MSVQIQKRRFTTDDYHKMAEVGILKPTDRVELINGEILKKMSPIKSLHSSVVDDLHEWLVLELAGKVIVKAQNPVRIGKYSEPEPDIAVVKLKKDRYRSRHPTPKDVYLLIEVSDSTLKIDREIKLPVYAEAGIPEYWIIDLTAQQIEVYRQPEGNGYKFKVIIPAKETVACTTVKFEFSLHRLLG